jgi:tetratricopeptide (TPR) repeat protein
LRTRQKSHRILNWMLPFCLLLLACGVSTARAQEGKARIKDGRDRYFGAYFDEAIKYLQEAFEDSSLDYGDSTFGYSFLAASSAKLGRLEDRDKYFRKILRRNIDARLRDELEEFFQSFEAVRAQVKSEHPCRLTVASAPEGAAVHVDGSFRGQTPLAIESLPSGNTYAVMLTKAGYDTIETSLHVSGDTSLVVELREASSRVAGQPWPIQTGIPDGGPSVRSYMVGLSAGAALGLASYFASVQFDNMAAGKIKAYTMAGDSAYAREMKGEALQYHSLGSVFYYSSYPLIAVGFYIGLKLSDRFVPDDVSLLGEDSPTRVCCSLDKYLNLSLGVRRSIW